MFTPVLISETPIILTYYSIATEALAQALFERLKSDTDIRGEKLQQLFGCDNNSAAIKRVEELSALRGLSKDHFVGALAKGLVGSRSTALDYYTMYGASTDVQKVHASTELSHEYFVNMSTSVNMTLWLMPPRLNAHTPVFTAHPHIAQVQAIFEQMDKNRDGKLNLAELSNLLKDTVGGDVEASAQEILTKLGASDVTLQQLNQLYASAATDESARTWLRSIDGDYAKMPYAPKFSTTGSHAGLCGHDRVHRLA